MDLSFLQSQVFWASVIEIVVAMFPSALAIITALKGALQSKQLNAETSETVKEMKLMLRKKDNDCLEYRKIIAEQQEQIERMEKINRRLIDHIDEGV